MPGAERLVSEAVMMGAIPIVSNRWTGTSESDFPSIKKVDHQNDTEVSIAILDSILNFDSYTISPANGEFLSYILSMNRRYQNTAKIYFGSSFLNFILAPKSLNEEHIANLQILAILHMYPLASVDIYVSDPLWYIRHHYKFFTKLKVFSSTTANIMRTLLIKFFFN